MLWLDTWNTSCGLLPPFVTSLLGRGTVGQIPLKSYDMFSLKVSVWVGQGAIQVRQRSLKTVAKNPLSQSVASGTYR